MPVSRVAASVLVIMCVLSASSGASAQARAAVPRIGVLSPFLGPDTAFFETLRQRLQELGYVEGRSVSFVYRAAEGFDQLQALALEMVKLNVAVIVTAGPQGVRAAMNATRTIPIVMGNVGDPVNQGFIASLAKPGGNVTGVSSLNTELSAKRLALLKDTLPRARRIAMLVYLDSGPDHDVRETRTAAQLLGLHVQRVDVRLDDLARSFSDAKKERADAVDVLASAWLNAHRERLVELAAQNGLPAIYESRDYVDAGGLMSYGQNITLLFRRAATYVHKILKGATPADLPWEQPSQFELVLNLKTAKALGLTFPPSLLLRADQVIE